jgi:hypothetical protein
VYTIMNDENVRNDDVDDEVCVCVCVCVCARARRRWGYGNRTQKKLRSIRVRQSETDTYATEHIKRNPRKGSDKKLRDFMHMGHVDAPLHLVLSLQFAL